MTSDLYQKIFHCILLVIIIVTCYSGTLGNSWHFDDYNNIVWDKSIRIDSLSWEQVKKPIYSENGDIRDRPLAVLTFAVNYLFSGLDTTGYHVVNIFIHIICSFFVYLVFIVTLNLYRQQYKSSIPENLIKDIALLGAVLWAIHPIQTQAVTYIVQRMASMAAMFYMISLYFYLKFRLQKETKCKVVLLVLCILFWGAGILSKENAALLPLSIIAYEVIIFRTSLKDNLRFRLFFVGSLISLIVFSLIFMSGDIISYLDKTYSARPYTMWERLITQPIILTRYIFLLLVPVADFLTLDTNIFASKGLFSPPITIVANLFIFILITLSIYFSRKYPLICFAIIFYFINHLVESTIIGLELYFEHRNYLPSVFIYLVISYFFLSICWHYKRQGKKFMYYLFVCFIFFIVVAEGNATYLRNEVWKDDITLYSDNLDKAPLNIRVYNNLAAEYMRLGQNEKALEYLKQAEKIYKKYPDNFQKNSVADVYCNAGIIYLHVKGEIEKATQLLLKSAELFPSNFMVHYHLAIAYFKLGDLGNAETAILNTVRLNGGEAPIYNLLGRILYAGGKYDLAVKAFDNGLELEKERLLYLNCVASYLALGEFKRARSVLFVMDAKDDDLLYWLYRLVAASEPEKDDVISTIVDLLAVRYISFEKFIAGLSDNNNLHIIFPDISSFEEELYSAYVLKIAKIISGANRGLDQSVYPSPSLSDEH
jgi:tetratricopeptide (TPR) repeat protein